MLITFVFLLMGTGTAMGSLKKECPPPEATSCSCVLRSGALIFCPRISNRESLQNTYKALKGLVIEKLTISEVNASSVPPDLYQGMHVEELVLEKCEAEDATLPSGTWHFQGLENSLHTLELKKSFRRYRPLSNLKLDHLKVLNMVLMEDNRISEVGNDWFPEGPKSLSTLIFERNGIEELGDRAFHSLENLKLLAVAGNDLHEVSRSMLPSPANNLQTLDLAYNKIKELPSDLFTKMPFLKDVNVGHNLIHILPEDTWSSVLLQLTDLSLEGNPLECDIKLKWLCELRVGSISGKCASPADKRNLTVKQFCKA